METVDSFANVSPNRRLARAVHRLVREALLPLHRSHAIAQVSLRREATE